MDTATPKTVPISGDTQVILNTTGQTHGNLFSTANSSPVSNFSNTATQVVDADRFTTADQGLVSDETRMAIFAVYTWLMPANSLLTILFCTVNAAVYWQQRTATFALYLIGVDIGDGLCAVVKLCSNVAYFSLPSHAFDRLLIDWYLAKYLALSFRRAAVCLNLLASLERFLAIAFPLETISRRAFGPPVAIVVGVFLSCLGAHSFLVLEYHVMLEKDGDWRLTPTEWKLVNPEVFIILGHVSSVMFAFVPLTAILVLNLLLLVKLRAHASTLKSVRRARGTKREDTACDLFDKNELVAESSTWFKSEGIKDVQRPQPSTSSCKLVSECQNPEDRSRGMSANTPYPIPTSGKDSPRGNISDVNIPSTNPMMYEDHKDRHIHQSGSKPPSVSPTPNSRKTSRSKVHPDASVTRLVMLFTSVFVLLALPDMLSYTARVLLPEYGPEGREVNLFKTVSTISMLVSHLTEPCLFWVSFAYSGHFRRAVFCLPGARWCCWRCLTSATSLVTTSFRDVSRQS